MSTCLAERLTLLRRESKRNQRSVADDLGISQALLSHYENGAREPRLEFIIKLCDYYGVTADYLLGITDRRSNSGNMGFSNLPPDTEMLLEKVQSIFDTLAEQANPELTASTVDYLSISADNIDYMFRNPDHTYDAMRDSEIKKIEAIFVNNVRKIL